MTAGAGGHAAGHGAASRRSARSAGRGVPGGRLPGLTQRLLLIALLLAGVLVGLRGGFTAPGLHGPLRHDSVAVGAGLEAVLAVLLAILLVWERQRPTADFATRRLRIALRAVLLAGLAAVPIVLLAYGPLRGPLPSQGHSARPVPPRTLRPARAGPSSAAHLPLAGLLYTLLGLVLLAAIVASVLLLRRRPPARDSVPPEEASLADGQRAGLRAAVWSGQRAMAGVDDTRAAIIACYLAMERSLAAAGADRTDADTPAEFLDRAAAAGLVRTAAAGQLTGLFYEARFSEHRLTGADRSAAEHALSQLGADLAGGSG